MRTRSDLRFASSAKHTCGSSASAPESPFPFPSSSRCHTTCADCRRAVDPEIRHFSVGKMQVRGSLDDQYRLMLPGTLPDGLVDDLRAIASS